MTRFILFLMLFFLSNLMSTTASAGFDIQILFVGQFHGDEITAESGEEWYGLFPAGDGFELRQTKITIEIVHDGIVDGEDEKTGKIVTTDQDDEPVFLVKGIPNLENKLIDTAFYGSEFIYPGQSKWLGFEGGYALHGLGNASEHESSFSEIIVDNYRIRMNHQHQTQMIATVQRFASTDATPNLIWAGDLDGDGKLDLLMDLTWHYNVKLPALFLSSQAEDGDLLKKVAELLQTGC